MFIPIKDIPAASIFRPKQFYKKNFAGTISNPDGVNIYRFPVPEIELPSRPNQEGGFLDRIAVSNAESAFLMTISFMTMMLSISSIWHSFYFILNGLVPLGRTVIFPMMLGSFIENF